MVFYLFYFIFGLILTIGAIAILVIRRKRLGRLGLAFWILFPILYWVVPFLAGSWYGIQNVYDVADLPEDRSFLDGDWIGEHRLLEQPAMISFEEGQFSASGLPSTEGYREGERLKVDSLKGPVEFVNWASGAAMLLNEFDPVYLARQSGEWRLVMNLDVQTGSRIVFRKSDAELPRD